MDIKESMFDQMIQYNLIHDQFKADIVKIKGHERPPMIDIPEYREKFRIKT